MKTVLILFLSIICIHSHGQIPELINYSDKAVILDTTIKVKGDIKRIYSGPQNFNGQNSYFSNGVVWFDSLTTESIVTRQSYYEDLWLTNSTLKKIAVFDSTSGNRLKMSKNQFLGGLFLSDGPYQNIDLNNNVFVRSRDTGNSSTLMLMRITSSDNLNFNNNTIISAYFINCTLNNSLFKFNSYRQLNFSGCKANDLHFLVETFQDKVIIDSLNHTGNLIFEDCIINGTVEIHNINTPNNRTVTFIGSTLPDTIDLSNNRNIGTLIDFTKANYTFRTKKIALILNDFPLDKIKLDYRYFNLIFAKREAKENISSDEKSTIYEGLLANFKTNGYSSSYELLDIEYTRHKIKNSFLGFLWFVPEYWNNYGYSKGRVFLWAIFFLLGFTIVTFQLFDTLTREVYVFDNIPLQPRLQQVRVSRQKWKLLGRRWWYSFVYTAAIFFLLWLKIEKLKFSKRGHLIYLMILYTIGIICIAYMAGFVLQK